MAGGVLVAATAWVACAMAQQPRGGGPQAPLPQSADGHDLTVKVTDVKGKDGQIVIALFTKEDGFPADIGKAAKTATVALDKPTHTFEKLPAGKYVVVVFHDRNKNGKVDKTLLGPPKEPIGLSNHPKISPPRNMPDFDKAKVDVSKATSIEVNLIELGL
jgi:uncharacterized protein (DUF2141 family)